MSNRASSDDSASLEASGGGGKHRKAFMNMISSAGRNSSRESTRSRSRSRSCSLSSRDGRSVGESSDGGGDSSGNQPHRSDVPLISATASDSETRLKFTSKKKTNKKEGSPTRLMEISDEDLINLVMEMRKEISAINVGLMQCYAEVNEKKLKDKNEIVAIAIADETSESEQTVFQYFCLCCK